MPYLLVQGADVAEEIRRIAAEELDHAIAQLRQEDDAHRDQGIHEARKNIKKLRGVVRLLMPGLGESGARDNVTLRNMGRALSGLRDAAALIETVETLSERYFSDPAMEQLAVIRSALRRRLEATVRSEDCRTVTGGVVAALKGLKRRAVRWHIGEGAFAALEPGLQETYRRGRKALRRVQADPSAENLHRLRKRVKDHWYQVRLLGGAWAVPASQAGLAVAGGAVETGTREKTLRELQECLGDDHNLTTLRAALEEDPGSFGGKRIVPAVLGLIARAQGELREQSLPAATRIYAEKPAVHAQRAGAMWESWQRAAGIPKPPTSTVAKRRRTAA